MTQERLPPHDTRAEEAVNGALLIDGSLMFKVAALIKPEDFYHEHNRWIYQACMSLYQRSETISQITVAHELDHMKKLDDCGGAAYLSNLVANCPTTYEIESDAQIVYRLSVMRNLINAANQIAGIGYEANPDIPASLNKAEELLFKLRHGRESRDFTPIRQVLDKYFETPKQIQEDDFAQELPSIRSGFSKLDEFLGGLQRSDLVIVAGRPSMGKTSFALSIARNAAVDLGACVALFSLEMACEPLVLRLLSSEADVDFRKLRFGLHSEMEEKRIIEATGRLSEAKIYIDDSPILKTVEMRSKARRLHFEHGIDLMIVDYLQLLQGEGRVENRVQEISFISRTLKAIARELNVPLIAVSQLSRAVEWRASHKPQLSDLRESGSIEQDADLVLMLYRDDYYYPTREAWDQEHPGEEYPQGIAKVIIAKHRNGPTGEIDLRFSPKTAKFEDINTTTEEPSML